MALQNPLRLAELNNKCRTRFYWFDSLSIITVMRPLKTFSVLTSVLCIYTITDQLEAADQQTKQNFTANVLYYFLVAAYIYDFQSFRTYVQYHLKCSKSYFHSRMRK